MDPKARALARMFVKAADGSAGSLYGAIRNTGGCCGQRMSLTLCARVFIIVCSAGQEVTMPVSLIVLRCVVKS